jgi:hypothetical protein
MQVYNYSQVRQQFAAVFNTALKEDVIITRRDGNRFRLMSIRDKAAQKTSPLDVPGIDTAITLEEISAAIRECRSKRPE